MDNGAGSYRRFLDGDDEGIVEIIRVKQEQRITVHRALSQIRPEYGQALYLKFFEELTNEQIAYVLKKSRRQVENLIYQAKQSLKRELEKGDFFYEGLS